MEGLPRLAKPQKLCQESKRLTKQPLKYLYMGKEQTLATKIKAQGILPNQYQPNNAK